MSKKVKILCVVLGVLVIKSFSVSASEDTTVKVTQNSEKQLDLVELAKSEQENPFFSKKGLIDKLKKLIDKLKDGKSTEEESTQAVDNLEIENRSIGIEQAKIEVKDYSKRSSFFGVFGKGLIDKLKKLIDELKDDKFTEEEKKQVVDNLEREDENICDEQAKIEVKDYSKQSSFLGIFGEYLIDKLKDDKLKEDIAKQAVGDLEKEDPEIWDKQVKKAAKYYLEKSSYSRKALIYQLKFDEFTEEEANQAVNYVESENREIWNEQARKAAEEYLNKPSYGFFKARLINRLMCDKFTEEEAKQAVDLIEKEDPEIWNKQAKKAAQYYLELSGISKQGLIDKLKDDKFTGEEVKQAERAVNIVFGRRKDVK